MLHVDRWVEGLFARGVAVAVIAEVGEIGRERPDTVVREVDDVAGASEHGAEARAGQEGQPGDGRQHAEDGRAGGPEPGCDDSLEAVADGPAVCVPEREQHARDRDTETKPERAYVDQLAACHDQPADRDEDERCQVRGGADGGLHGMRDRPAAEPEPQDGGDEDARTDQPEPDELRMRLRDVELAARLPAAALLDPAGRFRGRAVGPLLARHRGALRPAGAHSSRSNEAVSIPKYVGASYDRQLGAEPAAEGAVEHQQLPEAVRERVRGALRVPVDELAECVSPHDVLDVLVVRRRVLAVAVGAVVRVTVAMIGARDKGNRPSAGR